MWNQKREKLYSAKGSNNILMEEGTWKYEGVTLFGCAETVYLGTEREALLEKILVKKKDLKRKE